VSNVLKSAPEQATATSPWAVAMLRIGVVAAGFAVAASILASATASAAVISPNVIAVALIALAIGIPHGAVDNLTLAGPITRSESRTYALRVPTDGCRVGRYAVIRLEFQRHRVHSDPPNFRWFKQGLLQGSLESRNRSQSSYSPMGTREGARGLTM